MSRDDRGMYYLLEDTSDRRGSAVGEPHFLTDSALNVAL